MQRTRRRPCDGKARTDQDGASQVTSDQEHRHVQFGGKQSEFVAGQRRHCRRLHTQGRQLHVSRCADSCQFGMRLKAHTADGLSSVRGRARRLCIVVRSDLRRRIARLMLLDELRCCQAAERQCASKAAAVAGHSDLHRQGATLSVDRTSSSVEAKPTASRCGEWPGARHCIAWHGTSGASAHWFCRRIAQLVPRYNTY